jgi:hypothetical protein
VQLFRERLEEYQKDFGGEGAVIDDIAFAWLALVYGVARYSYTDKQPKWLDKWQRPDLDQLSMETARRVCKSILDQMPEWDVAGNWRRTCHICPALNMDASAYMEAATNEIPTPKSILQEQAQAELEKKPAKKAAKKAGRTPTPAEVERGYDIGGNRIAYASDGKAMEITPRAKKAGKGRNS